MRPFPLLACFLTLGLACARPSPAAEPAPAAPTQAPAALRTVEVVLQTPSGNRLRVQAEVARSDAERERGLMFRRRLDPEAGMLFVMPGDRAWTFWMKNTLIPLDLIFADKDGRVVGVVPDARPLDESSSKVDTPSRYVLEVNGGWCRKHGVGVGATLVVPKDP